MERTSARPVPVGTRVQLFIDGYLVAGQTGLAERLHPAVKHPEPVLTASAPWERPDRAGLAGWVNALYAPDERRFRLWYYSRGTITAGGSPAEPAYQLYATSADGLHFERPALGLFEYAGSTENNILGAAGPETAADIWHGMVDCPEMAGVEPPDYRYKTIRWTGRDEQGRGTHGVFFSPDGLRWRAYEQNPVLRGRNAGDTVSGAKLRDTFYRYDPSGCPTATYAAFPKALVQVGRWRRRCVAVCTCDATTPGSPTVPFTAWSEPVLVLAPDALDDEMAEARLTAGRAALRYDHPDDHRCEFYGLLVFRCGDLFLGLLWIFDAAFEMSRLGDGNQHGLVEVQLVASRDLIHWHRAGHRQPVLARGAPGSFDSAMIFYHSFPLPVGDEWWIYYAGFDTAHRSTEQLDVGQRLQYLADVRAGRRHCSAIGLARVRREGFVSLAAGTAGGTLTTRPLQAGGSRLELNAAVGPRGEIRVEVQDEDGRPLPGFEAAACTPVRGDSVRAAVQWGDATGDTAWEHRPVCLAFHVREAELYGFRFASPPAVGVESTGTADG